MILGRELTIACAPDEQDALINAAAFLDGRMREVQKTGKVIGAERCAIMAALNIAHEYLTLQNDTGQAVADDSRVRSLERKIDLAMQEQQQISL